MNDLSAVASKLQRSLWPTILSLLSSKYFDSVYCQPYDSHDASLENLELDQLS